MRCARQIEEHVLRVGREAISNAVRHAQARVVRLALVYGDDTITLRVTDDGVGMDPETARQCVDLFFTTKPEGTGLGLAIVQFIVTQHGGTLDIRTEKGRGTTVQIRLPLASL